MDLHINSQLTLAHFFNYLLHILKVLIQNLLGLITWYG